MSTHIFVEFTYISNAVGCCNQNVLESQATHISEFRRPLLFMLYFHKGGLLTRKKPKLENRLRKSIVVNIISITYIFS